MLAGALLLIFLAQCVWLVKRTADTSAPDPGERFRITDGARQWRGGPAAGTAAAATYRAPNEFAYPGLEANDGYDPDHSPLWYLISAAPLLRWQQPLQADFISRQGWLAQRWLERVPYLLFGLLLGSSLVVRVAPSLRGRGRIHRAHTLLFFARHYSRDDVMGCRARNWRGFRSFWSDLHRHRRGAYALRAARSRAVELAAHFVAGGGNHARSRFAILAHHCCALGTGLYVVL